MTPDDDCSRVHATKWGTPATRPGRPADPSRPAARCHEGGRLPPTATVAHDRATTAVTCMRRGGGSYACELVFLLDEPLPAFRLQVLQRCLGIGYQRILHCGRLLPEYLCLCCCCRLCRCKIFLRTRGRCFRILHDPPVTRATMQNAGGERASSRIRISSVASSTAAARSLSAVPVKSSSLRCMSSTT